MDELGLDEVTQPGVARLRASSTSLKQGISLVAFVTIVSGAQKTRVNLSFQGLQGVSIIPCNLAKIFPLSWQEEVCHPSARALSFYRGLSTQSIRPFNERESRR